MRRPLTRNEPPRFAPVELAPGTTGLAAAVTLCMLTKRLEPGQFVWPSVTCTSRIPLSAPQLVALLDGID